MMCVRGLAVIGSHASVCLLLLGLVGCEARAQPDTPRLKVIADIQSNPESPFFLPLAEYPVSGERKSLPIGVFDSGTGGLTVLDAILKLDGFKNGTLEASPDQRPDLGGEDYVYLADSANMPYGRYAAEGKVDLLREHILKDAWFLLDRDYAVNPGDQTSSGKKDPAKVIVIACNTATAYGLEELRRAFADWRLDVGVIGVIDAGAVTAIDGLDGDGKGYVIGVMATEGTCASGGYPRAVRERFKNRFDHQDLHVVQQAGLGLAGAVDGDLSYIDPAATAPRGAGRYKGPGLGHPTSPVDPALWRDYHFDTTENHLLVEKNPEGRTLRVELNSVENYIRY
ncbi:MAG: glutamate racemase, partial [Planctomycetota bacterium]